MNYLFTTPRPMSYYAREYAHPSATLYVRTRPSESRSVAYANALAAEQDTPARGPVMAVHWSPTKQAFIP